MRNRETFTAGAEFSVPSGVELFPGDLPGVV